MNITALDLFLFPVSRSAIGKDYPSHQQACYFLAIIYKCKIGLSNFLKIILLFNDFKFYTLNHGVDLNAQDPFSDLLSLQNNIKVIKFQILK